MMKVILALFARLKIPLSHPKATFSSAIAGVVAITQSPDDFNVLFGSHIGPMVHVLAKWFGAFCMAVAAAGHSVVTKVEEDA